VILGLRVRIRLRKMSLEENCGKKFNYMPEVATHSIEQLSKFEGPSPVATDTGRKLRIQSCIALGGCTFGGIIE